MTAKKYNIKAVDCPKIWGSFSDQVAKDGGRSVNVSILVDKAKNLEEYDLPICHMHIPSEWLSGLSMIEVVGHIKMILDADLTKPILIDRDGWVADGKHRLAKALLEGERTIKAKRFDYDIYS